jgi:peptidoglycan/LPS O-acetylase OafA/YrhL
MFNYYKALGAFMIFVGLASIVLFFINLFRFYDDVYMLFFIFCICFIVGSVIFAYGYPETSRKSVARFTGITFIGIGLITILIFFADMIKILQVKDSDPIIPVFIVSMISGVTSIIIPENM